MPTTGCFIAGLAGAATALLLSAATAIGQEAWNYDDPSKWKDITSYEGCGKPIQSPIALGKATHNTWIGRRAKGPPAGSPFGLYAAPTIPLKAKNDGHTVEVEAPADEANFISFGRLDNTCGPGARQPCKERAPGDPAPFYLKQMHFHAPSEHTLPTRVATTPTPQQQFPLEAHFVHESRHTPARIAVLAVMFRAGKENAALAGLVSNLSKLTGTATNYDGSINLTQLIPPVGKNGYWPAGYYYWGSKTTPPCTGGIFWYVAKEPVEASQTQIDALATVLKKNNRPIQPRDGRNLGFYD